MHFVLEGPVFVNTVTFAIRGGCGTPSTLNELGPTGLVQVDLI